MRKFIGVILALGLVAVAFSGLFAATSDDAYVIARCTVSVSVLIPNTSEQVNLTAGGAGSVNEVRISTFVWVMNDSDGAICKWALRVSSQNESNDGGVADPWAQVTAPTAWTLSTDDTAAPNEVVLRCAFVSITAAESHFTGSAGYLSLNDQYYNIGTGFANPASDAYTDAWADGGYNDVNPNPGVQSTRNLYFRLRYPTAVTDQLYRRFVITVTAALAGN
ncbi:MAG: hypothetical protein KJ760_19475 [Proteobacteria bacterium]|nr:hypothetical protein [Pseudomonadota bacterium]MBU2567806.1 hypothetical protein [Elusimicrobiota bacterium]